MAIGNCAIPWCAGLRTLLRRDNGQCIIVVEAERGSLFNDLCPAYHARRKLNFRLSSQMAAVGSIILNYVGVWECWDKDFEQLYQVDPPADIFDTSGVVIPVLDPPII